MQLLITTQDRRRFLRGDILAVVPDTHVWSPYEIASTWLATTPEPAGLLDEHRAPFVRTTENFPSPHLAVAQFPSFRCDLNLADWWLEPDLTELGATRKRGERLWFLDLDALPPGVRNSLESPGGQAQLGANRLSTIRNRHDIDAVDDSTAWTGNTSLGNTKHRHPFTNARNRLGVA